MPRVLKTSRMIARAEQILAKHGFPGAKVMRDSSTPRGQVLLYTTRDLHGPQAGEATSEIVSKLGVQFIGEGRGWT